MFPVCEEVLPERALQGAPRWSHRISTLRRAAPAPPFSHMKGVHFPGGAKATLPEDQSRPLFDTVVMPRDAHGSPGTP